MRNLRNHHTLLILAIRVLIIAVASLDCHAESRGYASLIIDDLGNNLDAARQIIHLDAKITLSILPNTTYTDTIAKLGKNSHHEIMLHLPLQSIENRKASPGTLSLHMTKQAFIKQLRKDLSAVPYIKGINNHMGSLLTRHPGHMRWLMDELANKNNLFFVDSRTTRQSIAAQIASEHNIPNISRDVFLDPDTKAETMAKQFQHFIKLVHLRGYALAIAHPYPETIRFLKKHLGELKQQGIELIPVSELINKNGGHYVTCTGTTCAGL